MIYRPNDLGFRKAYSVSDITVESFEYFKFSDELADHLLCSIQLAHRDACDGSAGKVSDGSSRDPAKASTEDYFASAYLTGPVFGAQKNALLNGEQLGFIGRLATRPYHDEDWNLHAGFSGQTVFHPNVNANGAPGVSRTTLTFADFPEAAD